MNFITVFSLRGGNGFGPAISGLRLAAISFLWFFIFLIPPSAIAAQAVGQPMAGGDSIGILPVSLGKPAGCDWTSAYALNSGDYPEELVVAGYVYCGDDSAPYQWKGLSWSPLQMPEGVYSSGYAESVSDDPTTDPTFTYHAIDQDEGENGHWNSFVLTSGQPPVELSLLPDMTFIGSAKVSAQGNHIVGVNQSGDWDTGFTRRAVRWTREGNGWSAPEDIGEGVAVATTEDGGVAIGNGNGETWGFMAGSPWVWTANAEGGGETTLLEPDAMVYDITHSGSMIVGSRPEACSVPEWQCDLFAAAVYWILEDGQWVMHTLEPLDGVDRIALAVAEVNGQAIIVGFTFDHQSGIVGSVVWLPAADGTYGAPLRLESLGADSDSITWPADINRNGLVLGWSEIEPWGATTDVVWSLFEQLPFQINGGISDAWYDPATDGQGFLIIVMENIQTIFLAWYTYDTERPDESASANLGEPGHRWLTAQGSYADNRAVLDITFAEGGIFDSGTPAPVRRQDGTMTLEFSNCASGTVSYDIPSIGRQGVVPIQRVSQANIINCQKSAMPSQ